MQSLESDNNRTEERLFDSLYILQIGKSLSIFSLMQYQTSNFEVHFFFIMMRRTRHDFDLGGLECEVRHSL